MNGNDIMIDARMSESSGIGTYLHGLLTGLHEQDISNCHFTLLGNAAKLPKGPWIIRETSSPIYSLREQIRIPFEMSRQHADLLHSPHYNMSLLSASRTVVTIHDLIHLKFPEFWPSPIARAYANFFFHRIVPQARAILTVSENTKKDLMEMLNIADERITVTYPGVDHSRFQDLEPSAIAEFKHLGLESNYFLYIGNLKEFKNVEMLFDAYIDLRHRRRDTPDLVLAGRNFIPGFEKRLAASSGVRWLGPVERSLLPALYRNALGFIFPSLYEGFGLPPLEAMASGTPVICSNRASLPEVVGDAALLIDPENKDELSNAMGRLLDDANLRENLSAKGKQRALQFSWDKMAAQTLEVYKRCLN